MCVAERAWWNSVYDVLLNTVTPCLYTVILGPKSPEDSLPSKGGQAAAETARQQDELRRYRQDMAPLRPDQPRLREDFNRGGGRGARVVRQSDVLVVAMECLPAPSAVWLRQGGHYEDNHTASTTPASMCLMQLSRHLIGVWSKCRGLFARRPVWRSRAEW